MLALCAVAIVFGGLALLGLPLTMASIAVLPVLLGLAVDYAIQYQARAEGDGARRAGDRAPRRWRPAVGFLVLLLSPVPMVRGFGALLVVGVGGRAGAGADGGHGGADAGAAPAARPTARWRARCAARASWSTACARRRRGAMLRAGRRRARRGVLRRGASRHPRARARGRARSLAVVGWALDSRIAVVSDLPRLVPQDLAAVRDLDALQRDTGVAGEVDVLVEGADLTDPKVVAWMRDYQNERAAAPRLQRREKGCAGGELCPALSLPDLFRTPAAVGHARADPRAAGRRAAVLLAGGDHAGPQDRGAGVRHPAAVAGGAARGDAGHARAAATRRRA